MGRKTRTVTLLVGLVLAAGTTVAGPLGAAGGINGTGTLHCTVTGSVKYKPALKVLSSGAGTSTLKTTLTCTSGTGDGAHVLSGKSSTTTSHATTDCATVLQGPPTPGTGIIKWKAAVGTPKLNPSTVTLTATGGTTLPVVTQDSAGSSIGGSFNGDSATAHAVIAQSAAQILASCGGKGVKSLTLIPGSTFDLT